MFLPKILPWMSEGCAVLSNVNTTSVFSNEHNNYFVSWLHLHLDFFLCSKTYKDTFLNVQCDKHLMI